MIYGLQDPITQELHYIGVTKNCLESRLKAHLSEKPNLSWKKHKWFNHLRRGGLEPQIFEIEQIEEENWQESERFWISYFRGIGCNLYNLTEGGEGIPNPSDEIKRKIGKSNKEKLRGKTYQEIYGENAIEEAAKRGRSRKGKSIDEIYSKEESTRIRRMASDPNSNFQKNSHTEESNLKRRNSLPRGENHWTKKTEYPKSAIAKMKATKAANPNSGMKGRKHSKETKEKMRQSALRWRKERKENFKQ